MPCMPPVTTDNLSGHLPTSSTDSMAPTEMDSHQSPGNLAHVSQSSTTRSPPWLAATWTFDLPSRSKDPMSSMTPVSTDNVTQDLPAASTDYMAPVDLEASQSRDDPPHPSQNPTIDSMPSVVTAMASDPAALDLSMVPHHPSQTGHDLSKLEQCVTQYPILESLASVLPFRDLLHLASTSKTNRAAILYSKPLELSTTCGGFGIPLRLKAIVKQIEKDHREDTRDGSKPEKEVRYPLNYAPLTCNRDLQKMCKGCGDIVCNECRVHCYYSGAAFRPSTIHHDFHYLGQIGDLWVGMEPPRDPYYARLRTVLDLEEPVCWDVDSARRIRPVGGVDHTHDAGKVPMRDFVDMHEPRYNVSYILDLDLGQYEDGAGAFYTMVQLRKRWWCKICAPKPGLQFIRSPSDPIPDGPPRFCTCTLRKRYLDRWTCIPCAKSECQKDLEYHQNLVKRKKGKRHFEMLFTPKNCPCGVSLNIRNVFISCDWCGGEIRARQWAQ